VEEDSAILSYQGADLGRMADAAPWDEEGIHHIGVIFHAELEEFHNRVDGDIILDPFAASGGWILDVVLLVLPEFLDLSSEALDFASQVREDVTLLWNAESVDVSV